MSTSFSRLLKNGSTQVNLSGVVAIALLALPALWTLRVWHCWIGVPVVWDYGPAQLALRVHMLVAGVPLYRDFRIPPYVPMVYGPIVPWFTALLSPLFGSGVMASLEAGRAFTIASTLAVCGLIVLLARRCGASGVSATLVALAFILTPLVQRWGFAFRVDMPELACELSGLLLYTYGLAFPAVLVLVLGFFVKQGRVAAIAAVILCAWLMGERKRATQMAILWLALVGLVLGVLQLSNPWYWLNSFDAIAVLHYDLSAPPIFLALIALECAGLVYLAISNLVIGRSRDLLASCFLATAIIQDSLSSLRWGSYIYYFLPTLAALAIFAAPELDRLLGLAERGKTATRVLFGVAAAVILAIGFILLPRAGIATLGSPFGPLLECRPVNATQWNDAALKRLHNIAGPVYTDTAALTLVEPGRRLQWIDLMTLGAMKAKRSFHDRALIARIRKHRIGAFALDKSMLDRSWRGRDFFWPELRQAIAQNYVAVSSNGPPFLMVPRKVSLDSAGNR